MTAAPNLKLSQDPLLNSYSLSIVNWRINPTLLVRLTKNSNRWECRRRFLSSSQSQLEPHSCNASLIDEIRDLALEQASKAFLRRFLQGDEITSSVSTYHWRLLHLYHKFNVRCSLLTLCDRWSIPTRYHVRLIISCGNPNSRMHAVETRKHLDYYLASWRTAKRSYSENCLESSRCSSHRFWLQSSQCKGHVYVLYFHLHVLRLFPQFQEHG